MRAAGAWRSTGSSNWVSKKVPRWLVPMVISKPSAVSWRAIEKQPALFSSTSRPSCCRWKSAANRRMLDRLARSSSSSSMRSLPVPVTICSRTGSARDRSRQAMTMRAHILASWRVVSRPMPLLAPVMSTVLSCMPGRPPVVRPG